MDALQLHKFRQSENRRFIEFVKKNRRESVEAKSLKILLFSQTLAKNLTEPMSQKFQQFFGGELNRIFDTIFDDFLVRK